MEGTLYKRGAVNKAFKQRYCCIKVSTLIYKVDKLAPKVRGQIELKDAIYVNTPLQNPTSTTPGFMWGLSPAGGSRTYFFECASEAERKNWQAAVLACGATCYGAVDSFDWLYDHSSAPKLDPKACQVDAQSGGGKCKSMVYKSSYCILHYLLIAQQRDAPQWMPPEMAKQCPGCGAPFSRASKLKKQACRSCAQVFCEACTANTIALPKLGYRDDVAVCQTCLGFERERRNFVVKDLQLLLKGQVMTKHGKLAKKDRERLVQFNYETVSLDATDSTHKKSIFLRDISHIQTGVEPKLLKVITKSVKDVNCCFCVVATGGREWPLEVSDPKTAESWVRSIKQAVRFLCGRDLEHNDAKQD